MVDSIINKNGTDIMGLTGCPLGHSLSPAIHNCIYSHYDISAEYGLFETDEAGLSKIICKMRSGLIKGLNVTIPFKQTIIKHLDLLDDTSKKTGAANTILNSNGLLVGYNTDYYGFTKSLEYNDVDIYGRDVFVIGAGGVSRPIALSLLRGGSKVHVFGRDKKRAEAVCGSFSDVPGFIKPYDLAHISYYTRTLKPYMVVNCTPVGMKGYSGNIGLKYEDICKKVHVLYDVVYNPAVTDFLLLGKGCGCITIGGMDMLMLQAFEAIYIWTGKKIEFIHGKNLLKKEGVI